jgi:hypothetical protein
MDINKLRQAVSRAVDVVAFQPSDAQRRAKSNFWSFFAAGNALPPADVDLAMASKYAGDRRIEEWWKLEGFASWFSNKDEFRQKVEFMADVVLDEFFSMIRNPGTQATAKVAAGKVILEAAKKLNQKAPSEDAQVSEKIAKMSKEELEAYIRSRMDKLLDEEDSPIQ